MRLRALPAAVCLLSTTVHTESCTEQRDQQNLRPSRRCCPVTGIAQRTNFFFGDGARMRPVGVGGLLPAAAAASFGVSYLLRVDRCILSLFV